MGIFGYVESVDGTAIQQPDSALFAVRVVLGLLPGLIFLISIIFSHKANISRERFDKIKAELAERRAQEKNANASQPLDNKLEENNSIESDYENSFNENQSTEEEIPVQ